MIQQKLTSKQMLMDICSIGQHLNPFLDEDLEYRPLLKYLIDHSDWYYDEDLPMPTVKEISLKMGIAYYKVRKQLRQIYEDWVLVRGDYDGIPFSFKEIHYCFQIEGLLISRVVVMQVNDLPILPRVGEEIEITFFKAYLNTTEFYVKKVCHKFGENGLEVTIFLKPGEYNLYWHYRLDKAREEEELYFMEFFELNEWQLKKKLGVRS